MPDLTKLYNLLKQQHGDRAGWWPTQASNWRLEIMIGCILTQNTSWTNVEKALEKLYDKELIDVDKLLSIDMDELKELIHSSGYYNQKAKRLKRLAKFLDENPIQELLNKEVEELRPRLLNIKGIGPETADSILLYALEKPVFVIDAYTQRLIENLGLFKDKPSYHELQEYFMENVPRDVKLYKEYHGLIVEHGKSSCNPNELCQACKTFKER